jgi:eukaryotic-like serine/threonine-protein kinase
LLSLLRKLTRIERAAPTAAGLTVAVENGDSLRQLGRYELIEEIGSGTTGRVWLACDPKIGRRVAIKAIDLTIEFVPEELDGARQRFLREAQSAGRLTHPNIVTIYDAGESSGTAFIAMELVQGRRLSDFTEPGSLLPVPVVLDIAAMTADALNYAHRQNVVHRDIKPANIMYDSPTGSLKITDFGIARLIDVSRTRTGIVLGTPSFMSPEQLEGENVNGHTDLFALGVTLYQLLTGRLPFHGASMTKLMFVIANEPHPPVTQVRPGLPRHLDPLLDRALAKRPADRFESGAAMAAALREAARGIS